ncbi:hypothetical protein QBC36DRAFT_333827 [Triangularia setosa]|uniref:Uncharacterized protein n=1 Tax=Triangularia setosa TaxID=2587417 RepID=A0AAN6W6A0_9PEZI|nr:hypothetical protein QBC36DRAFT_333827 [Podospora setosa]
MTQLVTRSLTITSTFFMPHFTTVFKTLVVVIVIPLFAKSVMSLLCTLLLSCNPAFLMRLFTSVTILATSLDTLECTLKHTVIFAKFVSLIKPTR